MYRVTPVEDSSSSYQDVQVCEKQNILWPRIKRGGFQRTSKIHIDTRGIPRTIFANSGKEYVRMKDPHSNGFRYVPLVRR